MINIWGNNRANVLFSDEEIFLLSHIEETWHLDTRVSARSIPFDEMACQRDMRVRGIRLSDYARRGGNLRWFFPLPTEIQ